MRPGGAGARYSAAALGPTLRQDIMIRNLRDHAANERTFLAWVRTAIAVMAFGFLVEKFGLFLEMARATLKVGPRSSATPHFDEVAGVALMILGLGLVVVATFRFLKTAREIDDANEDAGVSSRLDVGLAVLIVLLGCSLLGYLAPTLLETLKL
jgi:putative membrane protein